jgi:hypothetical protein
MLVVNNTLSAYTLAAGEPFVLEVQLLDSAGRGVDINDEAMFLTFYNAGTRAIVRDFTGGEAQYEGERYSDATGEFFRWAFDGRFSESMFKLSSVRVELAQRLRNGRKIIGTGALLVNSSAISVPSLNAEQIADTAIRVTIKAAPMLGFPPSLTVGAVAFDGDTNMPAPAPVFTAQPSIAGTPTAGQPLSALTFTDGTVTGGAITARAYLLAGVSRTLGYVLQDNDVGAALTFQNTATGPGGTTVATSDAVAVQTAGTGTPALNALTVSNAFHKGEALPSGATLQNATVGSAISAYPGVSQSGTGATRGLSGTPTARSALFTETLNGASRDTLIFAPETANRTMPVGMNMSFINWYNINRVWLDHMKPAGAATPPATTNANGMPLTLNNNLAEYYVPLEAGVAYRIITDGDMDFSIFVAATQYNANFTKLGSDWTLTYGSTTTGPNNPISLRIRNLRTAPTYLNLVPETEVARFRSGKITRASFASSLSGVAWIRGMNWAGGINTTTANVVPEGSLSYETVGLGVPVSVQAAVSKELGVPWWFTFHHKITDAQFQAQFAVLDSLVAAGLPPYVEYSNEPWNSDFPGTAYGRQKAIDLGYGGGDYYAPNYWAGYRLQQLATLARGKGYRFVGGGQPADQSTGIAWYQGVDAVAGHLDSDIYAYTSTLYAKGTITGTPYESDLAEKQDQWVATNNYDAAMDNVLNYPGTQDDSNSVAKLQAGLVTAKNRAAARGHKTLLYEAQFHFNMYPYAGLRPDGPGPAPYAAFASRLIEQPVAKGGMTQMLEVAQAAGIDGYTAFDYSSREPNNSSGDYGLFGRPAFDAITEWWGRGAAVPPVFVTPPSYNVLTDFPGLQEYFVGSSGIELDGSGPAMLRWTDAKNSRSAQVNGTMPAPAYSATGWSSSRPSVSFTGGNGSAVVNRALGSDPFTVAFVCAPATGTGVVTLIGSQSGGICVDFNEQTLRLLRQGQAEVGVVPIGSARQAKHLVIVRGNGPNGAWDIEIDGVVPTGGSGTGVTFNSGNTYYLGFDTDGPGANFNGLIAAAPISNNYIADADRAAFRAYAKSFWGTV